ncbi:hypothetical protein E2C01_070628 [Portunus trituberculatus]|uniref:CCHC-type domain-containing protein n=1 Tax=Portunus trituberculatus TaxID=210409 RepID=A0A5B7HT80_PORTR|nr:hypothetical protein [Portunus trituberculatus]
MTARISQQQHVLEPGPCQLLPVTYASNAGARITSLGIVWIVIEEQCVVAGAALGKHVRCFKCGGLGHVASACSGNECGEREPVPPSSPGSL